MNNKQQAFFLSSAQAETKDLSIGKARWSFQNQMDFGTPSEALMNTGHVPQIGLLEFSFTNWFINISAALGNNKLYYSNDGGVLTKYTIVIPDGSYSVSALNDYFTQEQQATLGNIVFSVIANYSTNRMGISFGEVVGWFVHFGADSPYALTGFNSGQDVPIGKANTAYYTEYGTHLAQFNNISSIQVRCDLTSDSISNGRASSVIYQTQPTAEVGSTQSDRPGKIIYCTLTNTRFSQITIQLLDQNGNALRMSEDFGATIIVRY